MVFCEYDFQIKNWKLAEFGEEYFEATDDGDVKEVEKRRRNLQRYKIVLNSKSNEEALVCSVLFLYLLDSLL